MPSHTHGMTQIYQGFTLTYGGISCIVPTNPDAIGVNTLGNGGNQPHNNMPPFYVEYIWTRTA